MAEFEPWMYPDIYQQDRTPEPPRREQGEHPQVVSPAFNHQKMQFMLDYMIASRHSGRSVDVDSDHDRWKITKAASDLYNRAEKICQGE